MGGKTTAMVALAVAVLFAAGATADAQKRKRPQKKKTKKADENISAVLGDYNVKYEAIADNCTQTGMSLRKGKVTLADDKKLGFHVSIAMAPVMYGGDPKEGKFRVATKLGGTGIQGVLGKYSASGRVNDGVIQFVYIAEYFTNSKKPMCTQSWNASGVKD
jgi:hypothetical protein